MSASESAELLKKKVGEDSKVQFDGSYVYLKPPTISDASEVRSLVSQVSITEAPTVETMNQMQEVCVKALLVCIPDLEEEVAFAVFNKYGYKSDIIHEALTLCGMRWWADAMRDSTTKSEDKAEVQDDPKPTS